ncbi:MAG: TolB family protein [Anaerolineales bacterium]
MRHRTVYPVHVGKLYLLVTALVSVTLVAAQVSLTMAQTQDVCTTVVAEVTDSSFGVSDFWFATLDDSGNRITFASPRDWAGDNPGGAMRLFAYDATTEAFTQLNDENFGIFEMTANADGSLVALTSMGDLAGTNADGSLEVFLYNVISDTVTQITDSPLTGFDIFSRVPVVSADGSQIAYISTDDPTGGNPGASAQIFLYDVAGGTFSQITNLAGDGTDVSTWPVPGALSADGTRVAFSAPADLTGGNPDGGHEIFLYDTTTISLTQVTNTSGPVGGFFMVGLGRPPMNADGTRIVYVSREDPTGANPDGGSEVFLYDATTVTTTQVTNIPALGGFPQYAQISGDGARISFSATADLTGGNSDGNMEFYLYDVATDTFTQLTDTLLEPFFDEALWWGGINYDGTRLITSRVIEDMDFFNASTTLEYFEIVEDAQVSCPEQGGGQNKLFLPLVTAPLP